METSNNISDITLNFHVHDNNKPPNISKPLDDHKVNISRYTKISELKNKNSKAVEINSEDMISTYFSAVQEIVYFHVYPNYN
ncbi:9990_t:CDS:2 [Cetraspora pellucida]|uniref:9990_t:CDS:1 n=1 Tax=Cetraspora pellucida TaxID=1433469 RepID=A0A9N9HYJ7_9GLOM|nr:9990_t:CDS:2 [Cetraspora pellucida]